MNLGCACLFLCVFFLHYYYDYVIFSLIITIHLFTQLKDYKKTNQFLSFELP